MKRLLLTLLVLGLCCYINPAFTEEKPVEGDQKTEVRSIFIWQIPDPTPAQTVDEEQEIEENTPEEDNETGIEDEEIPLSMDDDITMKGYVEYTEDADAIYLKDDNNEFVLNLRVPQKFERWSATESTTLPQTTFAQNVYARSGDLTYNIAPVDTGASIKEGNFSFGTSYNESIDTSDLGFTTSFYTKYDRKHFSISSSYDKNAGVAYSRVVDKFSITPELKLNEHLSLKNVLTSDITRNRKQNSLILSIKPTNDDRVRFEFGAGQTYDENKAMIKSEVKFQTQFRW